MSDTFEQHAWLAFIRHNAGDPAQLAPNMTTLVNRHSELDALYRAELATIGHLRRDLATTRDAFVKVVELVHAYHRTIPAPDDPVIGLVCAPECGACQVIAAVPADILDAFEAYGDQFTATTAYQGDPQ